MTSSGTLTTRHTLPRGFQPLHGGPRSQLTLGTWGRLRLCPVLEGLEQLPGLCPLNASNIPLPRVVPTRDALGLARWTLERELAPGGRPLMHSLYFPGCFRSSRFLLVNGVLIGISFFTLYLPGLYFDSFCCRTQIDFNDEQNAVLVFIKFFQGIFFFPQGRQMSAKAFSSR